MARMFTVILLFLLAACHHQKKTAGNTEKEGYRLAWQDELDYKGLPDSSRWNYDPGGHEWGNQELQSNTPYR